MMLTMATRLALERRNENEWAIAHSIRLGPQIYPLLVLFQMVECEESYDDFKNERHQSRLIPRCLLHVSARCRENWFMRLDNWIFEITCESSTFFKLGTAVSKSTLLTFSRA